MTFPYRYAFRFPGDLGHKIWPATGCPWTGQRCRILAGSHQARGPKTTVLVELESGERLTTVRNALRFS